MRRAHEDGEVDALLSKRRCDLHTRRSVAQDADALAGQRQLLGPSGGMELRALKLLQVLDIRKAGDMQRPGGGYEKFGGIGAALIGHDMPLPAIKPTFLHGLPEDDVVAKLIFFGYTQQIRLYLASAGEAAAPARVMLEGVIVVMCRHVAAHAGINIFPPGASHFFRLLVDNEVGETCLLELNRHHHPGRSRADDDDTHVASRPLGLVRHFSLRCEGHAAANGLRFATNQVRSRRSSCLVFSS